MKKIVLIHLIFALIVFCAACAALQKETSSSTIEAQTVSQNGSRTTIEEEKRGNISLLDLVQGTGDIFEGICLSQTDAGDRGCDLEVLVKNVLSGTIKESETIIVRVLQKTANMKDINYLFFARPLSSVYEQKPLFWFADEIISETGEKQFAVNLPEFEGLNYGEILTLTEKCLGMADLSEKPVQGAYCRSEDPVDVFDFATHVLIVRVKDIMTNNISDRTSYLCEVIREIKGECPVPEIYVVAFKNALQINEKYLLMLSGESDSLVFTMAAKNAVFPAEYEGAFLTKP